MHGLLPNRSADQQPPPGAEPPVEACRQRLLSKRVMGQILPSENAGNAFSFSNEELLELPVFKGVSGTFLELNQGAVVKRKYKAGEDIVRQGENGSTAFYILEGEVDVFLEGPLSHVATE